jgi:hypothetical protein
MAATAQDSQQPLRGGEKKNEEDGEETEYSPFYGIDKGAVLQEARCFNAPQVDARKCQQVIGQDLYFPCACPATGHARARCSLTRADWGVRPLRGPGN